MNQQPRPTRRPTGPNRSHEKNKEILQTRAPKVKEIFGKFKKANDYMGVYFTSIEQPFITFKKQAEDFPEIFYFSKSIHKKAFIYDTKKDFDTVTNEKMNSLK